MRRREFLFVLGGAAAVWPLRAHAQQPERIPRLCFLTFDPGTLHSRSPRFDPFFDGLRDLGYVDGQTIAIDYLSADRQGERFPALATQCVGLNADIIAVSTTPAAKNATRTIPIVMIAVGDPVGTGLVDSLAQPGGNITGLSLMVPEAAAKRLALLKEAVPGIARVLVLSYLADPIGPLQVKALRDAAASLGVTLQIRDWYNFVCQQYCRRRSMPPLAESVNPNLNTCVSRSSFGSRLMALIHSIPQEPSNG
jgi:putative tryptophan/tyrosine transport system substrate-binding protein